MPVPKDGDIVKLISPMKLLSNAMARQWYGGEEGQRSIADGYGGQIVHVQNPQYHHDYFFTKEGPTFHFDDIEEYIK